MKKYPIKNDKIEIALAQNTEGVWSAMPAPTVRGYGAITRPVDYQEPVAAEPLKSELPLDTKTFRWAKWGKSDKYPQLTTKKLRSVPIANRAIKMLVDMAYGEGFAYKKESDIAELLDGAPFAYQPAVELFLRRNRHLHLFQAVLNNYFKHSQYFAVFTLDGNNKITKVEIPDCEFCRLEIQNDATQRIENLLYCKKFGSYTGVRDEDIIRIPLVDFWNVDEYLKENKSDKIAIHCTRYESGTYYYPMQPWAGLLFDDNWIDVAADIPIIARKANRDLVKIKYKIAVHANRFVKKYGQGFLKENFTHNGLTSDEIVDKYLKALEKRLSEGETLEKCISYVFDTDGMGKPIDDIIIESIDDKMQRGEWALSADKSDLQVVQSLGVSGSMIGLQPSGGKMGAGSGSDKNADFNTGISLNNLDQQICYEWFDFVSYVNGFGVVAVCKHKTLTTLNENKSGIKTEDKKSENQPK